MKSLSVNELKTKREQDPNLAVINTLSPDSFEKTHIPDTTNIPLESADFEQQVEQSVGGKDQPVVVYCASQDCHSSTKAGQKLEQAGFKHVFDFEGGAKAWQEAGRRLANLSPPPALKGILSCNTHS